MQQIALVDPKDAMHLSVAYMGVGIAILSDLGFSKETIMEITHDRAEKFPGYDSPALDTAQAYLELLLDQVAKGESTTEFLESQ